MLIIFLIEYLLFPFDALLLFCKSLFFSLELTRHFFNFSVLFVLSFPICCSIFKDRFALALRECPNNISHLFTFVNTFLQFFSDFFEKFLGFYFCAIIAAFSGDFVRFLPYFVPNLKVRNLKKWFLKNFFQKI